MSARDSLLTKEQLRTLLTNLPASCVGDSITNLPRVGISIAHHVMLRLEEEGVIEWKREAPQEICLTDFGIRFLNTL